MSSFAFKIAALVLSVGFLTHCGRLAEGEDGVDAAPAQCPISADTTSCNLPSETPCDFASPVDCRATQRWICKDGQWLNDVESRVGSPGGAIPCPPDTEVDDDAGAGED